LIGFLSEIFDASIVKIFIINYVSDGIIHIKKHNNNALKEKYKIELYPLTNFLG